MHCDEEGEYVLEGSSSALLPTFAIIPFGGAESSPFRTVSVEWNDILQPKVLWLYEAAEILSRRKTSTVMAHMVLPFRFTTILTNP